jgi:uncharacterized protein (TIGR03083 family)
LRRDGTLVGVRAENKEEPLHCVLDSDPVTCPQQVEHEAGDGGDREGGGHVVYGGQRLVQPVMDCMFNEVRVTVRVAKRESVRLEKEPHQRSLVGVRDPRPYSSQPRTGVLRLGRPPEGPQSTTHAAKDLHDELLLGAEMMEQDRCLCPQRGSQGPQRKVGDAVGDDVVDRAIKKFLSALGVRGAGHFGADLGRAIALAPFDDGARLYYNTRYINVNPSSRSPTVTLDYASIISDESSRIVHAYELDRRAAIPWSDRWTVATVARHVAATHQVVAEIVSGRPDADFGLFAQLHTPEKDSPEFVDWFRSGTASLLEQLSNVPADDECWSWFDSGRRVGWWARRMALEAVVHRGDTDAAQGKVFSIASDVAADGIDEYLDVFVAASRAARDAPAGPTISFECSDRRDRWWLDLSGRGERIVSREPRDASVRINGAAEQLLAIVWGRLSASDAASVEVTGDDTVLDRWSELVPPM